MSTSLNIGNMQPVCKWGVELITGADVRIEAAGMELSVVEEPVRWEGISVSGIQGGGWLRPATLKTPDGAFLEIGLIDWDCAEHDVRGVTFHRGKAAYERLIQSGRMSIFPFGDGERWVELSALKEAGKPRPTLGKVSWTDLDIALGGDSRKFLREHGAKSIGTREAVVSDDSRRREYLAASFVSEDVKFPFAAWLLTRALPIMRIASTGGATPVQRA